MITWRSSKPGTDLTSEEHQAFEQVLSGHAWVRAFSGTAVVALIYESERKELIDALSKVAQEVAGNREDGVRAHVLVSPPIPKESGTYAGWAPKEIWPELNKRFIQ